MREAIGIANSSKQALSIVSKLPAGSRVTIESALPAFRKAGTHLDGKGMVLHGSPLCRRPDGRLGCDGLVVLAASVLVQRIRVEDFLLDGISVRGPGARDVVIRDCECFYNRDDGIGISDHATNVLVSGCVLNGNGFRKKGKGVLVFDGAQAVLRNNLISANRDGVTVSRLARLRMENNLVLYNYDKGVGASSGWIEGYGNRIVGNGRSGAAEAAVGAIAGDVASGGVAPPNRDGLRAGLDSSVFLQDTVIADNGDNGVVALGSSRVILSGGSISGNKGRGVSASEHASIELREVELSGNHHGEFEIIGKEARVIRRVLSPEASASQQAPSSALR